MNGLFTKLFYCFFILLASLDIAAQTKFTASVNPSQAGKDEYITLTLTVENGNNVQNITPPALPGFNIVSGPNTSSEQNSINGVVSQSVSLSYILLPKKPGSYKINAATALVNGRTFKSNNLNIVVSKKPTGNVQQRNNVNAPMQSLLSGIDPFNEPQKDVQFSDYILRKGDNIDEKVSKNMQLKLQCNKTSCYVGEPLLATYKLYSRLRSESSLSKNPSFNGFSVVEMMQQNDPTVVSTEQLNGRTYNVYTIRKAQLYPLQAGQTELESASLDNRITFIKYSGNNGNNYYIDPNGMVTETVTLSSKPMSIQVKPLPETGKPDGFKGAVGNFTIESSLQKNNFSTDETGKLFITITGSGNMQLLTLPDITWPANFEVFDTKLTDNTDNKTVQISGSKSFEIPFSVGKEGNYQIPLINFSFFDPASG
ncbi:MAG: BatD family protein, partial [Ferruginibacter sp.]|nr:BatD family protein [Ferruginibacter sp.]